MKRPHTTGGAPSRKRPLLLTDRPASTSHGASLQTTHHTASTATTPLHHPDDESATSTPSKTRPHQTQHDSNRLLNTAEQAAVLLQVPASWLRKKAAAGHIPYTKIGRHLRFSADDLNAIIRDGARGPRHHSRS
ncbi:helix-turn-helix domain-containing protein [Streptomyces sp. NPDC021098]|uniref:helix-turn-helix domain-containing protein n=1 Tax=unclassified Streptomyces TaxID=2593676 RepID=UPI0037ACECCD